MSNRLTIRVLAKQLVAPLIDAGPDISFQLPLSMATITGTASDPDGTVDLIQWNQIAGPIATLNTPNSLILQVSNLIQGTYTFQLTVTDNDGQVSSDTMNLTVASENISPTANAGIDVTQSLPNSQIQLNGVGTDSDGTISSYQWAVISSPVGSNPSFSPNSNTQNPIIQDMNVAGTYTLQLSVVDNDGAIGTDTKIITIEESQANPPTINSIGPQLFDGRIPSGFLMGVLGGSIDVFKHPTPYKFDVVVSDIDNHPVTVTAELSYVTNGFIAATDTKVVLNGNGTAVMELDGLFLVGFQLDPVDYLLTITATDEDGLESVQTVNLSFYNSSSLGLINGGLPIALSPTINNGCITSYNGTFVVPTGQTGSLSFNSTGIISSTSGASLSNVGSGSYPFSISLANSNVSGVASGVTLSALLSDGDTGSLVLQRTASNHPNWDNSPC